MFDKLRKPFKENKLLESIINLNSKFILTTNYDKLLETTCTKQDKEFKIFSNKSVELANAHLTDMFYIFHIHGEVDNYESIILSEDDYFDLIINNQNLKRYLDSVLRNYYFIFIGYSLSDVDLKLFLRKVKTITNEFNPKIYMFVSDNLDIADKEDLEDKKIKLIGLPNYEFIPYFLNTINSTSNEFLLYETKNRNLINKVAEFFNINNEKYIHKDEKFGFIKNKNIIIIISLVDNFFIYNLMNINFVIEKIKNNGFTFENTNSFQIITYNYNEKMRMYCTDNQYIYIDYKRELYERLEIKKILENEIKEFEKKFFFEKNNTFNKNIEKAEEPFINSQKGEFLNNKQEDKIIKIIDNFIDSTNTHLTILGEFGSGKTTLSKYILYKYANDYLYKIKFSLIPIRIELKHQKNFDSFEKLILNWFDKYKININIEIFKLLIEENFILLILDGFDEMAINIKYSDRKQRFDMLNEAIKNHSKLILTSRPNYFFTTQNSIKDINDLSELGQSIKDISKIIILETFDDNQIKEYLEKANIKNLNEAYKAIKETYDLSTISHKPLLLNMIRKGLLKGELKEKIENKEEINSFVIYDSFINDWAKHASEQNEYKSIYFISIVEKLAEIFQITQKEKISLSEFDEIMKTLLNDRGFNEKEHFRDVIDEAFLRFEDDNYSFSIQSFFEFFLAKFIKKSLDKTNFNIFNSKEFSKETMLFLSQSYSVIEAEKKIDDLYSLLGFNLTKEGKRNLIIIISYLKRFKNLKNTKDNVTYKDINFSGIDLSHFNFSSSSIINCDFSETNLSYASFNSCNIENCIFYKTNLEYSFWKNVKIDKTKFNNVNLNFSIFLIKKQIFKKNNNTIYKSIHKQKVSKNFSFFSSNNKFHIETISIKSIIKNIKIQKDFNYKNDNIKSIIEIDNDLFAILTKDTILRIWNIKTLTQIDSKKNINYIKKVFINNNSLLCILENKTIKIYDPMDFEYTDTNIELNLGISSIIQVNNDVVINLLNGNNKILNLKTSKEKKGGILNKNAYLNGKKDYLYFLFEINEKVFAGIDNAHKIILFYTKNSELTHTLVEGHNDNINSLLNLNENKIITVSDDKTIKIWDIKKNKKIKSRYEDSKIINVLKINNVIITIHEKEIKLFKIDSLEKIFEKHENSFITSSCKIGKDIIAIGTENNIIHLYYIKNIGIEIEIQEIGYINLINGNSYFSKIKNYIFSYKDENNEYIKVMENNFEVPIWLCNEFQNRTEDEFYDYLLDEAKKLNSEYENIKNDETKTLPEILSPLRESYLKYTYAYNIALEKNLNTSNIEEEILRQAKILGVEE